MPESQFESVLNFFNITIDELYSRAMLEESSMYRLLSRTVEPDSYTLEKLSDILCVSKNEVLSLLKLSKKKSDNIILYPVFSSFHKLFYIFKMCAFEEAPGLSLNKYLSFIPGELKAEYRLLHGQMTVYDSQNVHVYSDNCIITHPFIFEQEEYIADLTRSSVLMITISGC